MRALWRWLRRDRIREVLDLAVLDSYEDELRHALRRADLLAVNDPMPDLAMRMGLKWPRR